MQQFKISQATLFDSNALRNIPAHYVLDSVITFWLSMPDAGELFARLNKNYVSNGPCKNCDVDNAVTGNETTGRT